MPVLKMRRRQGENASPLPSPREATFHPLLLSRVAPAPRFSLGFLRTSENSRPCSPRWGPVGRESRAHPPFPQGATHHGEVPGEGFLGDFSFRGS